MDQDQQERFAKAVERKKADAKAASEGAPTPGGPDPSDAGTVAQGSIDDTAHVQDDASVRDKNSRHGKVTADKWNQ